MEGPHWPASLNLSFARREDRTLLLRKSHQGPLQIQKVLYPEGPSIGHVAVLHPPGGIAAYDSLTVAAQLEAGARVCLTTPGATKWYRCPQGSSQQRLRFSLADDTVLEWLPRENILFDAAVAGMSLDVELAPHARFIGWDIVCFGRRARGEQWRSGELRLRSSIRQAGRPLWSEQADIRAGSGFQISPVGLAGLSVSGTLAAAGAKIDSELVAACRIIAPHDHDSRVGITAMPNILVARYLGHSSEDAFNWFTSLWALLRPALLGVAARELRLWAC
jgi:urease accessory protein